MSTDDDLYCSICRELFKDAVTLICCHDFCQECIDRYWDNDDIPSCPECRQEFPRRAYGPNYRLRRLVEKERMRTPPFCQAHSTVAVKYFCMVDSSLRCDSCLQDVVSSHSDGCCLPVQAALEKYTNSLQSSLRPLQSRQELLNKLHNQQSENLSWLKKNATILREEISSEFAKLHHFLNEREQQLLHQLTEKERDVQQKMMATLETLKEALVSAETAVSELKSRMILQNVDTFSFLSGIKDFSDTSCSERLQVNHKLTCGLVSNAEFLGEFRGPLLYATWKEMKSVVSPVPSCVTLDEKTAQRNLKLTDDRTGVELSYVKQQVPDLPERFYPCICVLGSQGYTSGKHYWEVEVGSKNEWTIGVAKESVSRKGDVTISTDTGYWAIWLRNGKEYGALESELVPLHLKIKPERIGVYVDYEGGQVSFYNANNSSHIYTFTSTFREKLYPVLSPGVHAKGTPSQCLKFCHFNL